MRVIDNGSKGILPAKSEAEVVPPVEKAISDPAVEDKGTEYETTCTNCLSQFAFRRTDEGVTMTNEGEVALDCPVCDTPLQIGGVTGVVRQRR